ncbi:hypothetical protein LTR16_006565, partial [Cryomyces antarcticus]
MVSGLPFQMDDADIFKDLAYVNSQWKEAKSSKRFEVVDPGSGKVWASCPDMDASDVDEAVKAAHASFLTYRKVNPRVRAQRLLKWDQLIREHRDDIAKIVT